MKCDVCGRPAIARLATTVEALDLTNWPEEFLMAADTRTTALMCPKCLRIFIQRGAEMIDGLEPQTLLAPEPLTDDERLGVIDADLDGGDFETSDFTDEHGNVYTRTDRGYVLTEYGPDHGPDAPPPNVALAPGRKPPKNLN